VKFSFGIEGQNLEVTRQFVFAGFATTRILQVFFATLSKAAP